MPHAACVQEDLRVPRVLHLLAAGRARRGARARAPAGPGTRVSITVHLFGHIAPLVNSRITCLCLARLSVYY